MDALEQALRVLQQYHAQAGEPEQENTRFLRATIECAPNARGHQNVCEQIIGCVDIAGKVDSDQLRTMVEQYKFGLLMPMQSKGRKTPVASDHSSNQSINLSAANIDVTILDAKRDSIRLKQLTLLRDRYRSVLSDTPDFHSVRRGLVERVPGTMSVFTQAAHILPFSLAPGRGGDEERAHNSLTWAIIRSFAGEDLSHELNGNDINRLENVMTLSTEEHALFGELHLWLEAIEGQDNTYRITVDDLSQDLPTAGRIIRLQSNTNGLPIPDSRYLALHAACAKVNHMTAAGKQIDRVLRDMEELQVLPEDGGSDILRIALQGISVH